MVQPGMTSASASADAGRQNRLNPSGKEWDLNDRSLYVNRELSWLAFNRRVLDQASDEHWPLLERLKFLAIFGSNLDEFFMIRVSGLHEQLEAEVNESGPDGLETREQLIQIRRIVQRDIAAASSILADDILPALAGKGVRVVQTFDSLSPEAEKWA